jgi:hypothetical protein
MNPFEKQRQLFAANRQYLAGLCRPDDPLVGAFMGGHAKGFKVTLYAVGVTRHFMVLQALTKKQEPDGPPMWLRPGDITNAALWGHGGGFREWFAENSEYELRFQTTSGDHYKISAMGGATMSRAMGEGYEEGMLAVAQWLAEARPPR